MKQPGSSTPSPSGQVPTHSAAEDAPAPDGSRSIWRDGSFVGLTISQFLGAFNDNLYKQMMLLLAIPATPGMPDQQDIATIVFSLPFVIFSGISGFLADRFSKTNVIVYAKAAEILAMGLGMLAFLNFASTGFTGLLIVLFLMGAHSTFFGPGKYGILPELFTTKQLPQVNGLILMTTFLAIIFGTVTAGLLSDLLVDDQQPLEQSARQLWKGSALCIGIAIAGWVVSHWIRRVPAAQPQLRMRFDSWTIPRETMAFLRTDKPLVGALVASSVFWLVSGVAILAVNSLGKVQLALSETATSIMTAFIGLGIAAGAVLAGKLCRGEANPRIIRAGLWGIVLTLAVISISWKIGEGQATAGNASVASGAAASMSLASTTQPGATDSPICAEPSTSTDTAASGSPSAYRHLLGFTGSLPILALLGMSAGFFAIPLQVFIQSRPPDDQKGRMVAVMNQANFLAILLSGVTYKLMNLVATAWDLPRSSLFAMMSLIVLPLLVWYHPRFGPRISSLETAHEGASA